MSAPADGPISPAQWREIFDAFDRALELEPSEREAFVSQCSASDPVLGAELRALFARAREASALDTPAAAFAELIFADAGAVGPTLPDELVGPYRVVATIGRGGMGAVYLAERADDQFRKRVALKLLPGWSVGEPHRVRRFLDERQILASLEHPDIARLLDGGVTPDGRPWFAMEYVEGEPVDRYCDQRNLPIERRLELFCRVCAAVEYAHRNLIVHRDLKPPNILVTSQGEVRLLDFGIAKLLDGGGDGTPTDLTQTGERVMTPLYASPEQVRGDVVSTASDVYALGVLLYRLVTGQLPYRLVSQRPHEVARAILEQEPVRPSQVARLNRRVGGDLDAIVLKALEKEPRDRYRSVEQLEADLHRHLTGHPVVARPASRLYEVQRFVRRHRVGVTVAIMVVLLIVGFSAITLVQSFRIRAQAERIALETQRARATVNHLLTVFRTSIPSAAPGAGTTSREVLDSSSAILQRDSSAEPGIRALMLFEAGMSYHALGLERRARELLELSLEIQRGMKGDPVQLAATLYVLGEILTSLRELDRAALAYTEAFELRRRALDARHLDVARTLNGLSAVRLAQGRPDEADALSRRALAIAQDRRAADPLEESRSLRGIGHALLARRQYDTAARVYEEALALSRKHLPEEHLEVAAGILDLAGARAGMGHRTIADSLLQYGIWLQRRSAPAGLAAAADSFRLHELSGPAPVPPPTRRFSSRIAFGSDRERPDPSGSLGHVEIYVMNPDGSGQQRVTVGDGRLNLPALSPDGTRIAFTSQRGVASEVFVVDVKGGSPRQITELAAKGLGARGVSWAPDGKSLVFTSAILGNIYVINVDGTGLRQLTNPPGRHSRPSWSPDGTRIAYVSNRSGLPEIYVMNADGTHATRVTVGAVRRPANHWSPAPSWSPDSRRIAFTSDQDGNEEIYVINADGTGLTRLTTDPAEDWGPSWSPDGRQIAFSRRVLGHHQIFVMNADGTNLVRLTELSPTIANFHPSWGRADPR